MASLGHIAVGMAAGRWAAGGRPTLVVALSMLGLCALSMLPDADVAAFALGIPYSHPWGHRGATHSLLFAAVAGALAALLIRRPRLAPLLIAVIASHALLDALTDGGLGVALLWPFTDRRYFFPLRPIPVAPIGPRFLSERGLLVAATEILYFLPAFAYAVWPRRPRRPAASGPSGT
jgi:inner membrane protein